MTSLVDDSILPKSAFRYLVALAPSFSRPFQLMKINSTESYDFFLVRFYRARIQLILLIRETFSILRTYVFVSRLTGFQI